MIYDGNDIRKQIEREVNEKLIDFGLMILYHLFVIAFGIFIGFIIFRVI